MNPIKALKCPTRIVFTGFLAIWPVFCATDAATGPILPERQADKLVDSFESETPLYKTSLRGKAKPKLTVRTGYAREGTRSLLVELEPTGDKQGRNSLNLNWQFEPKADWAAYEGLMLWYQSQDEESPGFTISVVEDGGAIYWQNIRPQPRMAGQWQAILLKHKAWTWSWEGPADKDRKLDLAGIRQLRIEIRATTGKPVVLALDGLGLYHEPPAYAGPVLGLTCTKDGFIRPPDGDYTLVVQASHVPAGKTVTVELRGTNYWGQTKLNKTLTLRGEAGVDRPPNNYIRFKNDGPDYIDLTGTLLMDGKPLYRTEKAFACVQPQDPEDTKPNPNSIFGIWVGGGPWSIGAKWTRTYCLGSDVKLVDGKYQFRDNPPGEYHPKADPRVSHTFYFSAMPQWLSSKPDRADWQKWSPKNWDDYDKFLQWVITGTKAGGFTYYEVWNEPVPYAYWMGSMESVVKLHEVTYKAIKKIQPDAVVLGPCPYTFLWEFLEQYFELGGAKWIDDVVIHAYSGNPDIDFAGNLRKLKSVMRKHGLGGRDIYITEKGYSTPDVTERQQAEYLVRAYLYAWSEGVRVLTWHMLWDYSGAGDPGYAILRHDHTPRPAYVAYATMTRVLERAKYLGPVTGLSPAQRGFRFEKRGKVIRVLWDTKEQSRFTLSGVESGETINLMGGSSKLAPAEGKVSVQLGGDPIYVVTEE